MNTGPASTPPAGKKTHWWSGLFKLPSLSSDLTKRVKGAWESANSWFASLGSWFKGFRRNSGESYRVKVRKERHEMGILGRARTGTKKVAEKVSGVAEEKLPVTESPTKEDILVTNFLDEGKGIFNFITGEQGPEGGVASASQVQLLAFLSLCIKRLKYKMEKYSTRAQIKELKTEERVEAIKEYTKRIEKYLQAIDHPKKIDDLRKEVQEDEEMDQQQKETCIRILNDIKKESRDAGAFQKLVINYKIPKENRNLDYDRYVNEVDSLTERQSSLEKDKQQLEQASEEEVKQIPKLKTEMLKNLTGKETVDESLETEIVLGLAARDLTSKITSKNYKAIEEIMIDLNSIAKKLAKKELFTNLKINYFVIWQDILENALEGLEETQEKEVFESLKMQLTPYMFQS